MGTRLLTLTICLTASVVAEAIDITGWSGLPWGTSKPAALKALRASGIHECNHSAGISCAAEGAEMLAIEDYRLDGIAFNVRLYFSPKFGLAQAILVSESRSDSFEKILSQLTSRYGRPGLESEYDGVNELLHTRWSWVKTHGKLALEADEATGVFSITYEARR